MVFAIYALFFLPYLIYGKIIKSIKDDLEAAEEYVANNGQQSSEA
jgi:p-aminobenzoyl-glutamate transporter AbgT